MEKRHKVKKVFFGLGLPEKKSLLSCENDLFKRLSVCLLLCLYLESPETTCVPGQIVL